MAEKVYDLRLSEAQLSVVYNALMEKVYWVNQMGDYPQTMGIELSREDARDAACTVVESIASGVHVAEADGYFHSEDIPYIIEAHF